MLTADFNIVNYKEIINKIIAYGYKFVKYPEQDIVKISNEKEVLLRHDIDFSLTAAKEIALQDYRSGIQSTFFIYLNSPFYNILFRDDKKRIDEILNLGHYIALHFDERISIGIEKEIEILTNLFPGARFDIISLHQPRINQHTKSVIKDNIPGHIMTSYDDDFFKEIKYISDSRCNFNEMEFNSILCSNKSFQLLLHPIWWFFEGDSIENKLLALCVGKLNEVKENLKKNISINLNL